MKISSVGGRGPGTVALPTDGMDKIRSVILSLYPSNHNDTQTFETHIWSKCKTAINHACNKYRVSM